MSIVLCARMWGRVGEVAIDFGREVYVPWQIAQGRVLYRDLAYIFGPLTETTYTVPPLSSKTLTPVGTFSLFCWPVLA